MTLKTNQKTEELINMVYLCGTIMTTFQYSHEYMGEKFYRFQLDVKRNSGVIDQIQVIISDRQLFFCDKKQGDRIAIEGQVRTYKIGKGKRTYVFTKNVYEPEVCDVNEVRFTGYICKKISYRYTPKGREIAEMILAVNREYYKTDYIPCICWGRNAKYVQALPIGYKLNVNGRLQSRKYPKIIDGKIEERITFEISISIFD